MDIHTNKPFLRCLIVWVVVAEDVFWEVGKFDSKEHMALELERSIQTKVFDVQGHKFCPKGGHCAVQQQFN